MKINKIGSILLSLAIAFGLWLYVITVISPDQERSYSAIPVTFQNASTLTERGLIMVSDDDLTVTVTLTGNRSDLNKIDAANLTVVADLSSIYEAGEYLLSYSVYPPSEVASSAVAVQSKEPSRITVQIAERASKEVPVQINYVGEVPEGYLLDKSGAELDFDAVTIMGPADVVNQIDHAAITVDCEGRTESISSSYRFELQDAEDNPVNAQRITTNVAEVSLMVRIVKTKNIPLKLNIVEGGGATQSTTQITLDPESITVSGSDAVMEGLEEIVLGTIDLAEIDGDTTLTFDIVLPEGVENISGITASTVDVRFDGLQTATFEVTNITPIHVTEGMQVQVLTKALTVTVRGPASQIQRLKANYIAAVVDLEGVSGTMTVEPVFTFGNNYPDVGVVGKYSVSVTVTTGQSNTTSE